MRITGVDIETTGLAQEEGHRIIEIAALTYDFGLDGSVREVDRFTQRVNPQRSIDPAAQAVHGISAADLIGQPTWDAVGPLVHKRLATTDLFVAHNAEFDAPFVALELIRIGLDVPFENVFCTMQNGRGAAPFGKVPNLGELCWACGVDYDPSAAHAADYDIKKTMECFFIGLRFGMYNIDHIWDKLQKR